MNNKEAIVRINNLIKMIKSPRTILPYCPEEMEALDLAIKALEEQRPSGDLISREALKKAFEDTVCIEPMPYAFVKQIIDNAPTVDAVDFERHSKLIKQAYQKGKDIRPQGECCGSCYLCDVGDCGVKLEKGGAE